MDILFNNKGFPLMMSGQQVYAEVVGKPTNYEKKKRDVISPHEVDRVRYITYANKQIMKWGGKNTFPTKADEVISSTSVLNTGLKFLRTVTLGQGLYACKVTGIDAKGNEELAPIENEEVQKFVSSRMVRRYLEKASRDYYKFGISFVELIPDADGKCFSALNVINDKFCRMTLPDMFGNSELCVSGTWPRTPSAEWEKQVRWLPVLQDYDPEFCAEAMALKGKLSSAIFRITDSWSNDDYYGEPVWLSAYILGWVEISHLVPKFLQSAYKNQVTWKWHVQIPYSYWERKFPEEKFEADERKKLIQQMMDQVELNLCGAENAEKPLFTHYAVNEMNGKIEEEWKITALDNKYKGGENLVTSAAANSEILFALMVNPTVLGATPSGNYTTNAGGSNIREAFLVNIANAWIDRQNLLDPIKLIVKQKFGIDCDIRFRNTVLTTLDTGAGTQKTVS